MGNCNHSLPPSIYHSPHVEHSLSPLLDFSWPQTTSLALLYYWMWKASWSTIVLKNFILQSPLSLICRTNLPIKSVSGMDDAWWMLPGSTISSGLGKYTRIIWHKFNGSITDLMTAFFGCMDHNLAWLYFLENDVFNGSAYVMHWDFAMVSLIVEPVQWLIEKHCSC